MEYQNTAAATAFNLADFEASDTAMLEVQNKKGDGPLLFNGQPVRVEIRSPGTKEASQAQHKLETAATTRTYAAMRGKASKETVESKRAERVEIRSPGTKEASSAQHKLETAATTRTYAAMRGKASKETVESKRAERVEKLLAVTVRFENFPASPQEVCGNPKLGYITDQVAAFHGDWGNF